MLDPWFRRGFYGTTRTVLRNLTTYIRHLIVGLDRVHGYKKRDGETVAAQLTDRGSDLVEKKSNISTAMRGQFKSSRRFAGRKIN